MKRAVGGGMGYCRGRYGREVWVWNVGPRRLTARDDVAYDYSPDPRSFFARDSTQEKHVVGRPPVCTRMTEMSVNFCD